MRPHVHHPGPDEPRQPSRAADRARRTPARHPVAGGPLHRDAGRGGRDLARAALPLLRRQAGVPHRGRTPRGRRPVRGDGARRRGQRRWSSSRARWPATSTTWRRTTRATSRSCAAPPAATRACARSTRSRATALTGRLFEGPVAEEAGAARAWSTPRPSGCIVRGWSAFTEEVVLDWVRDRRGISREELLVTLSASLPAILAPMSAG